MPRLSERQQVALLLRATRHSATYPPLSHCLALHSVSPTIYASWTSGRRRLWDRRRIDPASYLYSYLPPGVLPRTGKFSLQEHILFLAALQRVSEESGNHRWARLALLVPGRIGSECRRYYHRVGRAGFISPDGKVKRKLLSRAKVFIGKDAVVSRNAVFLRRHIRKFVPEQLPDVDDAMLRRPGAITIPASHMELLTYRPAKPSVSSKDGRDVRKMGASSFIAAHDGEKSVPEPDKGTSEKKSQPRTKKKMNTHKQGDNAIKKASRDPSAKTRVVASAASRHASSIPASSRKPPLPNSVGVKRRQDIPAGSAAVKSRKVLPKAMVKRGPITPAGSGKDSIKKSAIDRSQKTVGMPIRQPDRTESAAQPPPGPSGVFVDQSSAGGRMGKPVLLKLRIKRPEKVRTHVHCESRVTVTSRPGNSKTTIAQQPGAPNRTSNLSNESLGDPCLLNWSTCQYHALAKGSRPEAHFGSGLQSEIHHSREILKNNPADFKPTQAAVRAEKTAESLHTPTVQNPKTVSDKTQQLQSEVDLDRRKLSMPTGTNSCVQKGMLSLNGEQEADTGHEETRVPSSILLPSSRRMYGPLKPKIADVDNPVPTLEDQNSVSKFDAVEDSTLKAFILEDKSNYNMSGAAWRTGKDVSSCTLSLSLSSSMGSAVPIGESANVLTPGERKGPSITPLEPFHEDETISLMDPAETVPEDKLDAASEGNIDKISFAAASGTATTSQRILAELRVRPMQEMTTDTSQIANKRTSLDFLLCSEDNAMPLEPPMKIHHVGERPTKTQRETKYCCDFCRQQCEKGIDSDLFELVDVGTPEGARSWSLPRMGVTWTKAWANRHWSARLPTHELRKAEELFAMMHQQARDMHELIKIFERMTDATGVRLGHRGERKRLLREFEAMNGTLVESSSLLIRGVERASKTCPRSAPAQQPFSRHEPWRPEHLVSTNIEMGYIEMVTALAESWGARMSDVLQRVNEMETRQGMEVQAVWSICSVMSS